MKIGIDARLFGIKDRGIGRYTEKLIEYLEKISARGGSALGGDSQNEYFIFLRQDGFNQYQPQNKNFHKVLADFRPYSIKEQIIFPSKLYSYKLDLIHFTHFNVPIFYRKPFIITIHDLIISRFPESRATTLPYFLYKIKLLGYQTVLKNAVKSAAKIIAVSEATKKDIVEILKVDPKKIIVTYEGVDLPKISNFSAQGGPASGWQFPISKQIPNSKFKIPDSYILYVGAAYPHKNLERLFVAFKNLINLLTNNLSTYKLITNLHLVLVGKKDFFYQRLEDYAEKLGLKDKVIFTGEISDEELVGLYKNALFFVFPSLCEGFGLPGLEAMAYGLPVAASSVSSLPEIFCEASYYFNPYDTNEITQAMLKLITDENLRKELREKGFVQVKKYSWQKMAEKTLEIYKTRY